MFVYVCEDVAVCPCAGLHTVAAHLSLICTVSPPMSFNERARETFPSCFCGCMHTLICVCVAVFTCNEKVFAVS